MLLPSLRLRLLVLLPHLHGVLLLRPLPRGVRRVFPEATATTSIALSVLATLRLLLLVLLSHLGCIFLLRPLPCREGRIITA